MFESAPGKGAGYGWSGRPVAQKICFIRKEVKVATGSIQVDDYAWNRSASFLGLPYIAYFSQLMQKEQLPYLIGLISGENDEHAFNELMRYYYPGLLSFANSILNDRALAEEVIQDIFVQIWENKKTLPAINNLSNYLYRAVKYSCLAELSKKKRIHYGDLGESLAMAYTKSDSKILSEESLKYIAEAISKLPPRCRLIFRLIKDEGLKYSEVASILDISVKTVEAQMTIALRALSLSLQAAFPEYRNNFFSKKTGSS
ncbi:RNA polymerase sigma-70 factor [Niabella sp. CC-SYL272]|uniref:RNA polymerase sigma-70 factor n=1 Tax=Niabella agricola TaxID=2891571 RepID=UPI001F295F2E|nr:RNA polymerase sigma-70 factor [Niabella agricola]MCF3109148.1 RNA polymerase sigma-70 factor [Niabella agricola]